MNSQGEMIALLDDGTEQEIAGSPVLKQEPINRQLTLFIEDFVLCRLVTKKTELWVPGIVRNVPSPFSLPKNMYLIEVYQPGPKHVCST